MLRIVSFLALTLTALALVPYGAHLFSLPNKIGMTQEHYFIAQRAYDNWALMSLILFPAMLLNIILAVMLRGEGAAFYLALAGCFCMAATLAIFFAWTYPGNVATRNRRLRRPTGRSCAAAGSIRTPAMRSRCSPRSA